MTPSTALGGATATGRFFRDLRKLYAASQGRAVGPGEYGAALGAALGRAPLDGDEIAQFDRGHFVTAEILYRALLLAGEAVRPW